MIVNYRPHVTLLYIASIVTTFQMSLYIKATNQVHPNDCIINIPASEHLNTQNTRPRYVHKGQVQSLQTKHAEITCAKKAMLYLASLSSYTVEFTLKGPGAFGASSAVMSKLMEIFVDEDRADTIGLYTGCAIGTLALFGFILEKYTIEETNEESHRKDFSYLCALDKANQHGILKQLAVAYTHKKRMVSFLRNGKNWRSFDD